ncbi:MAG: DUF4625 domain-containing protein [Bacteroidales bacterium]
MNKHRLIIIGLISILLVIACDKEDRDTELPEIIMSGEDHFPHNCDTIYIGESFTLQALFTDNLELGSYSIDIHHNFDHHSHSTDMADCPMDPARAADVPLLYIRQFEIPAGLREYNASQVIEVPEGVDAGDYHLMVRLTDRTGWQAIRGISIKVIERP